MQMQQVQVGKDGRLRHLLTLEGLSRDMIHQILDNAASFLNVSNREIKKVPLLRGRSVFNLFFEDSTRTRTTFEIAATRLSADVVNLNISTSSTSKGESLLDTIDNLQAMAADVFVVRHSQSGAAHLIAQHVGDHVHVVNAGDGRHAHPTQGLLDMYTIRHFKKDFTKLSVAIVGDITHSRVARSDIHALTTLGVPDVRVVGPLTLLPGGLEQMGVSLHTDMRTALKDVDVVIMLRLQNERMRGALLPSPQEYSSDSAAAARSSRNSFPKPLPSAKMVATWLSVWVRDPSEPRSPSCASSSKFSTCLRFPNFSCFRSSRSMTCSTMNPCWTLPSRDQFRSLLRPSRGAREAQSPHSRVVSSPTEVSSEAMPEEHSSQWWARGNSIIDGGYCLVSAAMSRSSARMTSPYPAAFRRLVWTCAAGRCSLMLSARASVALRTSPGSSPRMFSTESTSTASSLTVTPGKPCRISPAVSKLRSSMRSAAPVVSVR